MQLFIYAGWSSVKNQKVQFLFAVHSPKDMLYFSSKKEKETDNPLQSREVHFAKEEKRLRYEKLKADLQEFCKK